MDQIVPDHQALPAMSRATGWLAGASCIAFAYVATTTLLLTRHGLDLTDEGYYLNAITYPDAYPSMPSAFGHILNPVLAAVAGDLARFRQLNVFATFVTALTVMWMVLGRLTRDSGVRDAPTKLWKAAICLGGATTAALVFYQGLFTPNYNTLGFLALTWALVGILIGTEPSTQRVVLPRILGWVIAGTSLGLMLVNKPTSAPLAAILLAAFAGRVGELRWRHVLTTFAASTVTVSIAIWLTHGSLSSYWESISRSRVILNLWIPGHPLDRLFGSVSFPVSTTEVSVATLLILTIMVASLRPTAVSWALCAATLMVVLVAAAWARSGEGPLRTVESWVLLTVPIGAVLASRLSAMSVPPGARAALPLALLPFAWAIGTNNNMLQQAGWASFLWVLAALWLLAPQRPEVALVAVSVAQVTTILVLMGWYATPYRQLAPLARQNAPAQVGPAHSELLVAAPMATYLDQLSDAAEVNGLSARTPLIDLTEVSPTASYALGAVNLGFPWHGSQALTAFVLEEQPCPTLRSAVILANGGKDMAGPAFLNDLGLDFPNSYMASRPILAPDGSTQTLWFPKGGNNSSC